MVAIHFVQCQTINWSHFRQNRSKFSVYIVFSGMPDIVVRPESNIDNHRFKGMFSHFEDMWGSATGFGEVRHLIRGLPLTETADTNPRSLEKPSF